LRLALNPLCIGTFICVPFNIRKCDNSLDMRTNDRDADPMVAAETRTHIVGRMSAVVVANNGAWPRQFLRRDKRNADLRSTRSEGRLREHSHFHNVRILRVATV